MRTSGSRAAIAALAVATAVVLGVPVAAMAATGAATATVTSARAPAPAAARPAVLVTDHGPAAAAAASDLPLPAVCKKPKKATRTAQCRVGGTAFDLFNALGQKIMHGEIDFADWEFLDAKSRTWKHTTEMELTSVTGPARFDILLTSMGLSCNAGCDVVGHDTSGVHGLPVGVVLQHTFTVESPGSTTVNAVQVPRLIVDDISRITLNDFQAKGNPLVARCDSQKFQGNPPPGCVNAAFMPTFMISSDPKAGVSTVANHIAKAQLRLNHHWGLKGIGSPLHRTTDAALIRRNRAVACGKHRNPPHKTQNCDEYPFASTEEGAANNPDDFSWDWVDARENSRAGAFLGDFYAANRVLDHDAFWVRVT